MKKRRCITVHRNTDPNSSQRHPRTTTDQHAGNASGGGQQQILPADTVIICAGQESERSLFDELQKSRHSSELIGGAYKAAELNAKAAIKQASYSAAEI